MIQSIINWIRKDFHSHPIRFTLEILAWAMSVGCAIVMALTVPKPPFLILYPIFITQCAIFGWSAWTRKSSGMVANYLLLVFIDSVGLARLVFA